MSEELECPDLELKYLADARMHLGTATHAADRGRLENVTPFALLSIASSLVALVELLDGVTIPGGLQVYATTHES